MIIIGEPRLRTKTIVRDKTSTYFRKTWERYTPSGVPIDDWDFRVASSSTECRNCMDRTSIEMNDHVVKDYAKHIARGDIVINPLNVTKERIIDAPRNQYFADYQLVPLYSWTSNDPTLETPKIPIGKVGTENYGSLTSSAILGDPTLSATFAAVTEPYHDLVGLAEIATTQAYANIDVSRLNLAEQLAEMPETIKFLEQTILSATRILHAAWRLDLKRALLLSKSLITKGQKFMHVKKSLKSLASGYMQCRYAVRPLVHDVEDVLHYFQAPELNKAWRFTSRGSTKMVTENKSPETLNYSSTYGKFYGHTTIHRKTTCRAGVLNSLGSDYSLVQDLGLDNLFGAAWELIPLSFVADWFFNISQTIASLTPEFGVKELASWVTIEDIITRTKDISRRTLSLNPSPPNYYRYDINNCYVKRISYTKQRIIGVSPRVYPKFVLRINALKLLDLGIICQQLYKKLIRSESTPKHPRKRVSTLLWDNSWSDI